jgi:prophage regulatory protein
MQQVSNILYEVRSITMMKRKDVVQATGLCYTTIYNLEKAGNFPARRQLSPGRVAWMRPEVENWLQTRVAVGVGCTACPVS